jgi:hypothetical protein
MKREDEGGRERRWRAEVVWEQPTVEEDCVGRMMSNK